MELDCGQSIISFSERRNEILEKSSNELRDISWHWREMSVRDDRSLSGNDTPHQKVMGFLIILGYSCLQFRMQDVC